MSINITDYSITYWNSMIKVNIDKEENIDFKLKDETLKQIRTLIEPEVKAKIEELVTRIKE